MKRWFRRFLAVLTLAAAAVLTSSCGALSFTMNPQDLYCLPELPAKYTELNRELNAILETGAEYAAPTAGTNIQPVQLTDLDGDGRQEAVAFFRNTADEKPLKIYIFKVEGNSYHQSAVIEGSGTGINSIVYNDMDKDGRMELTVGWRVNADLLALAVYALRPNGPEELIRTNYVRYDIADLDENNLLELVAFRSDEEGAGVADLYSWQDGSLALRSSARISFSMAELSQQGRVSGGNLADGAPALFVTGVSATDNRAITDILTVRSGELNNIVVSGVTGVSTEIAPYSSLYPRDLNGDGVTEVPHPEPLPDWEEGGPSYQRVDWKYYNSSGEPAAAFSPYHNTEDGWYLRLPEEWQDQILVSRVIGLEETSVTFYIRQESPEPFLRITAITGANREARAVRGGRFNLSRQETTFYVAELLEANNTWIYGLTEDEVREAFSLITAEWSLGEN